MVIQQAGPGNYAELAALWEASVRATHHFLSEEDILFFKPLILNEYLAAVDLYYAQNASGGIQGFLGVSARKIEMLFIAPQYFGQGVGKRLLLFAVNQLGAGEVDVNEQNPQALGFYKHLGFKIVSRSPVDSMGKPFPILHMQLAGDKGSP